MGGERTGRGWKRKKASVAGAEGRMESVREAGRDQGPDQPGPRGPGWVVL